MKRLNSSVLILFILMASKSCDNSEDKPITHTAFGTYGVSYSLDDSKTRKVFDEELSGAFVIPIDNREDLKVTASWVEHKWTFKESQSESKVQEGEQLIIEFEPNPWMRTYIEEWIIISASTYKIFGKVGDNACYLRYPNKLAIEDREFIVLEGRARVKDSSQIAPRKIGEFTIE